MKNKIFASGLTLSLLAFALNASAEGVSILLYKHYSLKDDAVISDAIQNNNTAIDAGTYSPPTSTSSGTSTGTSIGDSSTTGSVTIGEDISGATTTDSGSTDDGTEQANSDSVSAVLLLSLSLVNTTTGTLTGPDANGNYTYTPGSTTTPTFAVQASDTSDNTDGITNYSGSVDQGALTSTTSVPTNWSLNTNEAGGYNVTFSAEEVDAVTVSDSATVTVAATLPIIKGLPNLGITLI